MREKDFSYEIFMQRCFDLAIKGTGKTSSNPLVGAVVVHENKIIGEGWHQKLGEAHAEVNAIRAIAKEDNNKIGDSILFVNLEPCCHYGKTPPCTDLILKSGIKKVVISNDDPNPLVAGKGKQILQSHGCTVISGILASEGEWVNRRFFVFQRQRRPYIILKWAQSADGFFTRNNHQQHWITGNASRRLVHRWRSEEMAVMAGTNTALVDDPQLTNRLWISDDQPVRVVIDRNLRLPENLNVFNNAAKTIIFNEKISKKSLNLEFIRIPFSKNMLAKIMEVLFELKIISILVEGGAQLLQSFINDQLWDEARIFTGQKFFGSGIPAPIISANTFLEEKIGGDNLRVLTKAL